jgi:hypothetical protein
MFAHSSTEQGCLDADNRRNQPLNSEPDCQISWWVYIGGESPDGAAAYKRKRPRLGYVVGRSSNSPPPKSAHNNRNGWGKGMYTARMGYCGK